MATKIGFLIENFAETAVLSATNEVAGLGVDNLKTAQPSEPHRQTGAMYRVVADLGAPKAVGAVWARNVNWTEAATWRWRAAATEADLTAAPAYDSGSVGFWPAPAGKTFPYYVDPILFIATDQTYRWWRLDADDPTNPDPYLQAGGIGLTLPFHPTRNLQFGFRHGVVKRTKQSAADSGATFELVRAAQKRLEITVKATAAEGLGRVGDIDDRLAAGNDIGVVVFPDDRESYFRLSVFGGSGDEDLDFNERSRLNTSDRQFRFTARL